ncbi:glycosyltransferase [Halobellus sp. GM3]|uniref:glycosyltransferase n=1 Tax=Halobellus sp. GM3 TaxID=3458410 RepID=UPI00403E13B1
MISELYPPEVVGGAEKYVQTLSERLVERGHKVTILATGESTQYDYRFSSEMIEGIQVYRVAPLNMYSPIEHPEQPMWKKPIQHSIDIWNPYMFLLIRKKISEIDPDLVHIHNYSGFSTAVFRAAGKLYPSCHTLHDYSLLHILPDMYLAGRTRESPILMAPFRLWNRVQVTPYVDTVMAPSNFLLEKHHSYGLFTDTDSRTLRLGIDSDANVLNQKSDPQDEFRLLYVGNISEKKGVLLLTEIFSDLDELGICLDIVGKGPEKPTVEDIAQNYTNVHIHGFISEKKLSNLYQSAHSTIVPSKWYDNSPMVIYESYSYGTPVIGAMSGGIPELIDDGVTGYLFESGSSSAMLKAIKDARSSISHKLFENSLAKSEEFSLTGHIDELASIYRNLINKF